jgi:hypothetical protein
MAVCKAGANQKGIPLYRQTFLSSSSSSSSSSSQLNRSFNSFHYICIMNNTFTLSSNIQKRIIFIIYQWHRHIADLSGNGGKEFVLPVPAFNVINGGRHAGNSFTYSNFCFSLHIRILVLIRMLHLLTLSFVD